MKIKRAAGICFAAVGALCSVGVGKASALPFETTPRNGFTVANYGTTSYDVLPKYDFLSVLFSSGALESTISSINPFLGLPGGNTISMTWLGGAGAFVEQGLNKFGVIADGQFQTGINSATNALGDTVTFNQAEGQQFTFALQSPEGVFSAVDSQNADGAAHIITRTVTKDTTINLNPATLGGASLSFSLFAGDVVCFAEDLLKNGIPGLLGGLKADFDYNDFIVVVRKGQAVPEPATATLLALGGFAAARRRRRNAA